MKSVLVTGGTGFIGVPLVKALSAGNHQVTVLTRDPSAARRQLSGAVNVIATLDALNCIPDVVVNLAGEPLAARRWSAETKAFIWDSRIGFTDKLFDFFERKGKFPARIINGSAIGYYGNCGDQMLDERKPAGTDFAAQLCRDWELSAKQFEQRGSSLCVLRIGIVLGTNGGALKQILPAFRLGLGGPMGSGKQYMSWIHIDDMVRLILFVIDHPVVTGPVNAVSTEPVTNFEFSRILASVLRRPALLPMPAFVLRLLFGEIADVILLASQRVLPTQALGGGFEFRYPDLKDAFEDLLIK
ncbi:TIGR01777 family oxidoreductase [Cellvibrio mixtus]|uniref:TIGR01777 family oxidoreductase n=1 Tax=Cellvibrio mixtus TaxID=39650 RepID=UPI000587815C|nr:TIGR01777 family oxidoreductase [Cellvibrio mixtus]